MQSLASIFVESSLGGKRKDSDSAKKFIDEQIKVYEKKLEEAENRLKEFKLKQPDRRPSADGKDYFTPAHRARRRSSTRRGSSCAKPRIRATR